MRGDLRQPSARARLWIIGNETNLASEWPNYGGTHQRITPEMYAQCFAAARDAIKAVSSSHAVILQGVSPGTADFPDPFGYYREILDHLGPGRVDGIALHTYATGTDPSTVQGGEFRKYRGFLRATPSWARFLPVYISESSPGGPWPGTNTGWINAAYKEIDVWNRIPANQPIRTLALYHWDPVYEANLALKDRPNAVEDFRGAAANEYRWNATNLPHGRFFLQSAFGVRGNFETVVAASSGPGLVHFWRDNDAAQTPWRGPTPFAQNLGTVASVSLIQSNYDGNLDVVARVGGGLVHLYRDGSGVWRQSVTFGSGLSGNPALIQSRSGKQGNFEVVVPLAAGGMAHFYRDNDARNNPWVRSGSFGGSSVVSAVALIQSNYGSLEVVARIGGQLAHFSRPPGGSWSGATSFGPKDAAGTPNASGAPGFIQARYTNPGNFVVITPLAGGGMARFARDNNNSSFPWLLRESFAAGHQTGAVSLMQSNYGRAGIQEVLSREVGSLKLYHSYYDGDASPPRWKGPYAIGV